MKFQPIRLANGRVQLEIVGEADERFTIQASTNLLDWETIGVATNNAGGQFEFEDAQAAHFFNRYYRIVSQ